jgi:hypothetical protein
MIGQAIEFVLNSVLSSRASLLVIAAMLPVLAIVWWRAQAQELREGEALRERERACPESLWNQ